MHRWFPHCTMTNNHLLVYKCGNPPYLKQPLCSAVVHLMGLSAVMHKLLYNCSKAEAAPCCSWFSFPSVACVITLISIVIYVFFNSYYVCICEVLSFPFLEAIRTIQGLESLKHELRMTWREADLCPTNPAPICLVPWEQISKWFWNANLVVKSCSTVNVKFTQRCFVHMWAHQDLLGGIRVCFGHWAFKLKA